METELMTWYLVGRVLSTHIVLSTKWYLVVPPLPRWHSGKESACRCRRCKRCRFSPWVRKITWSRKWQPAPVFLPLQTMGSQRVGHDWSHWACMHFIDGDLFFTWQSVWLIRHFSVSSSRLKGLPWWSSDWESTLQCREHRFDPWLGN